MAIKLLDQDGAQQATLDAPIHCTGVGLHSGARIRMRLCPAPADSGILFRRVDVAPEIADIPATWRQVVDTTLCTAIANHAGTSVGTVEHLMAALRGLGIDNALIELDGPEVPIMDGSSAAFVFLIESAGVAVQAAPRRPIRVVRPVEVRDGDAMARLEPAEGSVFSVVIDFDSPVIARQSRDFTLVPGGFKHELAEARTFGFLKDVERLRSMGLARGGSLDNAIVVGDDRVLNPEGLRYEDEFVRHKILDAVGDLYLAGAPIIGRFVGHRSGHAMNHRLVTALLADLGTTADPATPDGEGGGRGARQMKVAAAPA